MFYKNLTGNKRGNLTLVLIGLISVMMLTTMIISKRMSSHTRLLTLSDYTQISRYFLESYASDVLQQFKYKANKDGSELAEYISTKKLDELDGNVLVKKLHYEPNESLKVIADDYGISYENIKVEISQSTNSADANSDFDSYSDWFEDGDLGYPDIIKSSKQMVKEKKGLVKIVCECNFKNRRYKLEVQYPFSLVFRMTPVLKDFMLFVNNMYEEQKFGEQISGDNSRGNLDKINVLYISDGKFVEDKKPADIKREFGSGNDFRPFILSNLVASTSAGVSEESVSGMVYLGPTTDSNGNFDDRMRKAIFLNLAGVSTDKVDQNKDWSSKDLIEFDDVETNLISTKVLDFEKNNENTEDMIDFSNANKPIFFEFADKSDKLNKYYTYGSNYGLYKNAGNIKFGVFGFCEELTNFLGDNGKYNFEEFFGSDTTIISGTYWEQIKDKTSEAFPYASGLKIYGKRIYIDKKLTAPPPRRLIFGNVFARYCLFSFWEPPQGQGMALTYEPIGYSIDNLVLKSWTKLFDDHQDIYFKTKNYDDLDEEGKKSVYQKIMSKIVSGFKIEDNFLRSGNGQRQEQFMPFNRAYKSNSDNSWENEIYDEDNFKPNDGFSINKCGFDRFGSKWFNASIEERLKTIEGRIGKVFLDDKFENGKKAGEKFKEAVGYPDKFNINGVIYVGGDLNLSEPMTLKPEDCGGGIILVDGNITLNNINRGSGVDTDKFIYCSDNSTAEDYFTKWTNKDIGKDDYIGPEKIFTFVCLKEHKTITIKGNILLGVQLINLTEDSNNAPNTVEDQIRWNIDEDNKDEIIFYGSIVCNRLNLVKRMIEFGKQNSRDKKYNAPFIIYPPVMATSTPPLVFQISENMRGYKLTSGAIEE